MATFAPQMRCVMISSTAPAHPRLVSQAAKNPVLLRRTQNVLVRAGKNVRDEIDGAPGVPVLDNKQKDSYERIEAPVRDTVPDGGPPVAERRQGRDDMFIQEDGAAEKKVLGTEVALPDIMRFNGAGPEVINSRLAMIGCVTALIAELTTGKTVVQQVASAPLLVAGVGTLFTVASLITMVKGTVRKGNGFFSSDAEIINGRIAMIGFAGILLNEVLTKSPALVGF